MNSLVREEVDSFMTRKLADVYCGGCRHIFEPTDLITIDIMNCLSHQDCKLTGTPIKDSGTYEENAQKYPYFYKITIER